MPRTTSAGLPRPVKRLIATAVLAVLAYVAYLSAHITHRRLPDMICALLITAALFTLFGAFERGDTR